MYAICTRKNELILDGMPFVFKGNVSTAFLDRVIRRLYKIYIYLHKCFKHFHLDKYKITSIYIKRYGVRVLGLREDSLPSQNADRPLPERKTTITSQQYDDPSTKIMTERRKCRPCSPIL